ncbi:hypothetical protein JYT44_01770 [Caldithrix abyssi]|nr:hypothetical protein [Caldithrix abyssi]
MLKNIIVKIISVSFLVAPASSQYANQKYAITDQDKKVILNDNGTWKYIKEEKQNYHYKNSPTKKYNYEFKPKLWKERLEQAAHEYWRIRAHAELEQLGIPVTRYDPTTSDVPLFLKLEGGRIRTDFDPFTPLARGEVVDIAGLWDISRGDNPTLTIHGKLFLQLTMKLEDQKRLFSQYEQRNYIPIHEDFQRILEFRDSLDIIALGMHDYNRDNTHIWPGIPHSYLYAPPGTPYDPNNPPVIHGDGFPYIQRGHLTLARREIEMTNSDYSNLLKQIDKLKGHGPIKVGYDMGNENIETIIFEEVWLKINPYNGDPTRVLSKVSLKK